MPDFKILDAYAPLFYSDKTYFLISGGRSSGKSTQVAAYFLMKLLEKEYFRGVITRYTQKSLTNSIYRDILDLAEKWGIMNLLDMKGDEIRCKLNGNMIITHAMKMAEGTMSAKGKGISNVTHLLIDEATELPDEEEYIKLNDSFRVKGVERKIFIIFNPTSKLHWIHKRWYIDGKPNPKWFIDTEFIHTTYKDNIDNIDLKKIEEWERMKETDMEYYSKHILGEWQEAYEGRVYSGWKFEKIPDEIWEDSNVGLDFGFSSDPAAAVRTKIIGDKLYVKQLMYDTGMTNQDIYKHLTKIGISSKQLIVCDSSEPKSIEELKRLGLKVKGALKGVGSVIFGIKKIQQYQVICDVDSTDLINEYNSYCWKKNSDYPEDKNNHLADAVRYSIETEKKVGNYGSYSGRKKQHEWEYNS